METSKQKLGKVSITVEKEPWSENKEYPRLTVVLRESTNTCYISRKAVPIGTTINNREYWLKFSALNQTPYELSQEFGDSTELGISQKTLTEAYNEVKEEIEEIEEITSDKPYSPETFSGLGKVHLKKNIVEDKNILTQDMLTEANAIYYIQYDYDLNGETITVPDNCVLKFNGGSFKNGTLIGTNTNIYGTLNCIDVLLKGSYIGTFDDSWIVFDEVASTKNYENVATLINNYHDNIHWNGRHINLETTNTEINLEPGKDYNFNNTTFSCENHIEYKNFFKLVSVPIDSDETDINALASSELFTYHRGIIFAEDKTPLYKRVGDYDYSYYRKDALMVENNVLLNSPCLPYDDPECEPALKYIILNHNGTTIRNVHFERSGDKKIKCLYSQYQYNLTINNVSVDTLVDLDVMDEMFSINDSHTLNLENISSSKNYRDGNIYTGGAYIFMLMYVTNLFCNNINVTSNSWGIFGTRGINGAHIQNSAINRFDIHCYGKNLLFTNCTFMKFYNQLQCVTGYITFRNCTFIKHGGLWMYNTPVSVYSSVTYDNCVFESLRTDRGYLIWLKYTNGNSEATRSLFSTPTFPSLSIRDCQLYYESEMTSPKPLYYIDAVAFPDNASDISISINGLTIDYNNADSYILNYSNGINKCSLEINNLQWLNMPTDLIEYKRAFTPISDRNLASKTYINARNSTLNKLKLIINGRYDNCTFLLSGIFSTEGNNSYTNCIIYVTPNSNTNRVTFDNGYFDRCRFKIIGPKNVDYFYRFNSGGKISLRYCIFEDSIWSDELKTAISKCYFKELDSVLHFAKQSNNHIWACVVDSMDITSEDITALMETRRLVSGRFYVNDAWRYYILNEEVTLEVYMRSLYGSSLNTIWDDNKDKIAGIQFYNTNEKKLLVSDGDNWRDAGGVVHSTPQSGTTAERPKGSDIVIGFCYFDSDLGGKPIFAKSINNDTVTWVDATGTTV